jgi:hypothetical protein
MSFKYVFNFLILIFLIFSFSNSIFAVYMDVKVTEEIDIIDSGNDQFRVLSSGIFKISNPSLSDYIYEYGLEFKRSVVFDNDFDGRRLDFYNSNILGRNLAPGQTISYNFEFSGFLPKKFVDDILSDNVSFFEWYVEDIYFSPLKIASIHKKDREAGVESFSRREVLVTGLNPTEFDVEIVAIKLSKTDSDDYYDFKNLESLLDIFTLDSLAPGENFSFSTYDELSDDTSVYWIDYKIDTLNSIEYDFEVYYESDDEFEIEVPDYVEPSFDEALSKVDFRKSFDDSNIVIGTYFDIYLTIINTNNFTLSNLNLFDSVPSNLRLFDRHGDELSEFVAEIDSIKPFETKMFVYELKFYDTSVDLFYLQPAILRFMGDTIYSNPLTLVNDLSASEEKVLIEKTVDKYFDGGGEVKIKVENIGDIDLYDLEVIEVLQVLDNSSDNVSRNSSYVPKSWNIPVLEVGEVWEVSYVVLDDESLYFITDLYGIESSNVFRTTVINDEIKSSPIDAKTSKVITGLAILGVIILFVDILLS